MVTKVQAKKENKRSSLFHHAYDLFLNKGFNDTTISDIVKKSDVAKGTFYLYVKDKYDLRDQLVARVSAQILLDAQNKLEQTKDTEPAQTFEGYVLKLINLILDHFESNQMQLRFISKNLSWGVLRHMLTHRPDTVPDDLDAVADLNDPVADLNLFYRRYLDALTRANYHCDRPDLLLFTVIELVGSSAYSTIINEAPCTLQEYKPYLFRSVHQILEGYRMPEQKASNALS